MINARKSSAICGMVSDHCAIGGRTMFFWRCAYFCIWISVNRSNWLYIEYVMHLKYNDQYISFSYWLQIWHQRTSPSKYSYSNGSTNMRAQVVLKLSAFADVRPWDSVKRNTAVAIRNICQYHNREDTVAGFKLGRIETGWIKRILWS